MCETVEVPLAVCPGVGHGLCGQCERQADAGAQVPGNPLTRPMMRRPGECFNYTMKGKTRGLQSKSNAARELRICPLCKQCV